MGKKFVTFSFDDGVEQDKEIIRILKSFGLNGATFNLNSGIFGRQEILEHEGDEGVAVYEDLSLWKSNPDRYARLCRIPKDEIAQVYEGFEVASHGYEHLNLAELTSEQMEKEITGDIKNLEEIIGTDVVGFVYAYGVHTDKAREVLKKNGILYARTVETTQSHNISSEPLKLKSNRWIGELDTIDALGAFIEAEPKEENQMFYIWGHGYEFDYGTERNNWEKFKRLCDLIANNDQIICCKNRDLFT